MLETIASYVQICADHAPVWGFAMIFVFMTIESSFIPFPSEVVMIPAGFLAYRCELGVSSPILGLIISVLVGAVGSLAGAYVNYYLSLKAGKPFLEKYGKYVFIKRESLDRSCQLFNKYGASTTFICRLIPCVRQLISIPAGLSKMPLWSFSLYTTMGAGLWSAILAAVGYFLAQNVGSEMADNPDFYRDLVMRGADLASKNMPWIIGGVVVLVLLRFIVSKLLSKRR